MSDASVPALCFGRVFHRRLRPARHQFSVGVFFLRVPVDALCQLSNRWFSVDRFNLLSFYQRDFGPRDGSDLQRWAQNLLRVEGVDRADGPIVLQAFPRVLGYVFNPIAIWYCYDRAGGLRAAIAEVSNTFGERHNYLVAHADQHCIEATDILSARKVFHVSPFCEVKGHYQFRFEQTGARAFVRIDYFDDMTASAPESRGEPLLVTTLHGTPRIVNSRNSAIALLQHPFMTFGVVLRIHWHALRLWLKRVPFFSKPAAPAIETTR